MPSGAGCDIVDYDELGLKVGLEIHAQLDTRKLFCHCPTALNDDYDVSFMRRLRPTMSELGEIDPAAKEEFTKGIVNIYKASTKGSCLVYSDEEPPHEPNGDAIYILLQISRLLQADIVDQIQFMRKIVIDGSNVSGFQRTALVALNGKAFSKFGNVEIPTICLEEDAARLVENAGRSKIWNIDRLGTPLVEIATDPSIRSPEQARDVALFLGQAMKSTKRLKRGIGTIRQDVNISIREGTRVEIKGVQELNLIDDYVRNEALRQSNLVWVMKELMSREARPQNLEIMDVSDIFKETECKIIKGEVFGIRLPGFSGLLGKELQKGRRFGTELADYSRKYVKGIFHSDELPAYGISEEEVSRARDRITKEEGDAFVLVAAGQKTARKALSEVLRRANMAMVGVPNETRRPLPDGNSQYMRPLPGKSRMYPETDVYPFTIPDELMRDVVSNLPELPEDRISRLVSEHGISDENARKIVYWDIEDVFIRSQNVHKMPIGRFLRLVETITMLSKEGINIGFDSVDMIDSFMGRSKDIPIETYEDILRHAVEKNATIEESIKGVGIESASEDEIRAVIRGIIDENAATVEEKGNGAFKPLMGKAMGALKGKADGKAISKILNDELKRLL